MVGGRMPAQPLVSSAACRRRLAILLVGSAGCGGGAVMMIVPGPDDMTVVSGADLSRVNDDMTATAKDDLIAPPGQDMAAADLQAPPDVSSGVSWKAQTSGTTET